LLDFGAEALRGTAVVKSNVVRGAIWNRNQRHRSHYTPSHEGYHH
jgi:hypothetical protein